MWWQEIAHWLWIHTGTGNEPGSYYGFWSGFGSDIGEVTIIAGMLTVYRKHNCEVSGCWRLGRHDTAGGHTVCRKHHPDDKLTHQDVIDAHREAQNDC
jgi:hypothetical protein